MIRTDVHPNLKLFNKYVSILKGTTLYGFLNKQSKWWMFCEFTCLMCNEGNSSLEWLVLHKSTYHVEGPNRLIEWENVTAIPHHDLLEVFHFPGVSGNVIPHLPDLPFSRPIAKFKHTPSDQVLWYFFFSLSKSYLDVRAKLWPKHLYVCRPLEMRVTIAIRLGSTSPSTIAPT